MDILITNNPKNVYNILFNALDKLIENRIKDAAFTDQEDVTTKGYFSTLEGLEAILIPVVNLPKNLFWQPLLAHRPQLPEILEEDINFILSYNQKTQGNIPYKEQGTPYFLQGKGVRQTPYWTSECSSFTLSVLTNLMVLNEKFGLKIGPAGSKIVNTIKMNLEWVKLCKRDIGWAWTTDSPPHPWPTWSILDTFEEILNNDQLKEFHKEIESSCNEITDKIYKSFETDVAGSYKNEWYSKVENSTPYDIESTFDIIRLMLGISLHSSAREIKTLARMIFDWCGKTDFRNLDYTYHLAAKNDNIPDGSLVPMTFRTLLVMSGMLKPKHIEKLDDAISTNHEIIINRVYSHLIRSQINHGRYAGLWGVPNGGTNYELYYTERTIEGLTEFLLNYGKDLSIPTKKADIEIHSLGKTTSIIKKGESSKKKKAIDIAVPSLQVLDEVANDVIKKQEDSLQNISLVLVLHILSDLIPLVEKFLKLGCEPKNIYLIAKTYNYPDKDKLIKYLKENGYNVFEPKQPDHDSYQDTCIEILSRCIDKAKSENRKILIIEDGGYFVPLLHKDNYKEYIKYFIGAVEQTTKGHRRDKEIENYKIPIISVANSKLKRILEGDEVAHTLQENVIAFIKEYVKKPNHTLYVLVIGYGTIGKNLANFLADKSLKTSIYDDDKFKRIEAQLVSKITVIENLDDLSIFDMIIGTSGNTALNTKQYYWNLKHNVYLISGSSERVEFNLEILNSIASKVITEKIIREYILKKDKKIINLVCDGEPINFALSGGIAKPIIDPIYAEIFLSTMELINNKELEPGLIDVPEKIEMEVLDIYKDFYRN